MTDFVTDGGCPDNGNCDYGDGGGFADCAKQWCSDFNGGNGYPLGHPALWMGKIVHAKVDNTTKSPDALSDWTEGVNACDAVSKIADLEAAVGALESENYAIDFSDTGTELTITLKDGTVLSTDKIDEDDHVVSMQVVGANLVTTMDSGDVITTPLCNFDALAPLMIPEERYLSDTSTSGADFPVQSDTETVLFEQNISKSELEALGMRVTDNAVIIAAGAVVKVAGDTSDNGAAITAWVGLSGCDGAVSRRFNVASALYYQDGEFEDEESDRLSHVIPLNSDGSIDIRLSAATINISGVETVRAAGGFRLLGFQRVANPCYKATDICDPAAFQ